MSFIALVDNFIYLQFKCTNVCDVLQTMCKIKTFIIIIVIY